jgi:hypothetical protein
MYHRITRIGLCAIGIAVLGFVAVLATATPSSAASYTLNFAGTVTSATDLFSTLGVTSGDPISGSLTYNPFNDSLGIVLPTESFFSQGASSAYTFHVSHSGVFDFTHSDTGGGTVHSNATIHPTIEFNALNLVSFLSLRFQSDGVGTPLTTLIGLPTTSSTLFALLAGNPATATGNYKIDGLGQINFKVAFSVVAATPIPAALPLFGSGLVLLGFAVRKRRTILRAAA